MPPAASGHLNAAPFPSPPRRGARRRFILFIVLFGVFLAVLGLAGAAACRPRWYRPQALNLALLPVDKQELARLVDDIGAALNAGRSGEFTLSQAQLNRWLTARSELWPEAQLPSFDPLVRPVVVLLDNDRVRLAAEAPQAGFRLVLSADVHVAVDADAISVELDAARLGALAAPRDLVQNFLPGRDTDRITWQGGGVHVRNEFVWPSGKRRFRVERLRTADNAIHVTLAPLERTP